MYGFDAAFNNPPTHSLPAPSITSRKLPLLIIVAPVALTLIVPTILIVCLQRYLADSLKRTFFFIRILTLRQSARAALSSIKPFPFAPKSSGYKYVRSSTENSADQTRFLNKASLTIKLAVNAFNKNLFLRSIQNSCSIYIKNLMLYLITHL